MNGLISGQAGVAAIIEGNEARVISVDEKKKEIITSINLLYRYFMGATDVSAFNAPSENVVIEQQRKSRVVVLCCMDTQRLLTVVVITRVL